MDIRKNDTVIVTTGREKGKTGKVVSVLLDRGRVVVEKINRVKRHQKPTAKMRQGGIVEKEASLAVSNLMLYCTKCSKGSRVGHKLDKDGTRLRFCRRCGEVFAHV